MTSSPIAIPARSYINRLALKWLTHRWWLLAVPLAAAALWTLFDIRALFAVLALVFLLYPMSLTLVWFDYALSPQSMRTISSKLITVTDSGLRLDFIAKDEDSKPLPATFVRWDEILDADFGADSVTLILGKRLDDILYLPRKSFSDRAWQVILNKTSDMASQPFSF